MALDKVKERFENEVEPTLQTKIKKGIIVFVFMVFGLVYYYSSGRAESDQKVPVEKPVEVELSAALMEDDIRESITKDVIRTSEEAQMANEKYEALQSQTDDLKELIATLKNSTPNNQTPVTPNTVNDRSTPYGGGVEYPPSSNYFSDNSFTEQQSMPIAEPELIGSIGFVAGAKPLVEEAKTEKKRLIRLPPSFMKASLLVGIDAMTSQMGASNPEPIVLRVQAPAVLPNRVKQNLEGCFIVADAFGNLAKERVQVRLVSLHCNNIDGSAAIDQKIEGFVADTDGKRDLAGIVVSKAGANMARMALASIAGGFGTALGGVGTSTITTATATATNVDSSKVLIGAGAQGLGAGTTELAKIYTDLVKQATPTIEIGAAKQLVVFIQKPVELEIKTYN